jgi:hypothetical protein
MAKSGTRGAIATLNDMNEFFSRHNVVEHDTLACALLVLCAALNSGCSSNPVQAEWTDPAFTNHPLRGAKVLVLCEASDVPIQRVCEEQMRAQVATSGATPLSAPELSAARDSLSDKALATARSAGAKAVLFASVAPDDTLVNPGPSVGFGVGGYGGMGGYHSGAVEAGVGVSVPVGEGRTRTSYAANMVLKDVDSGRVMWTSKVSGPMAQDINMQMNSIARAGLEAAQKAGVF